MLRKKPLTRKSGPKARKPLARTQIKKRARKPSEFRRIYGSRARVAVVKRLPCAICLCSPCDNHHTRNGGTGRKAGWETIVPLCTGPEGCHAEMTNCSSVFWRGAFYRNKDLWPLAAELARAIPADGGGE